MARGSRFSSICLGLGLLLSFYPLAASSLEYSIQKDTLRTHEQQVQSSTQEERAAILEEARACNAALNAQRQGQGSSLATACSSDEGYAGLLSWQDGGEIMGTLEIPKISVILPIYHGTSEEVLSKGAGHLQGSSLPVGGAGTRTVLTAHRGLPTSKLFTRLDEMTEGDLFFVSVGDETLAYEVISLEVIEPEEVDALEPRAGEDLATLVTCTPYGINTHRLLVTGTRTEGERITEEQVQPAAPSRRETLFSWLPFGILALNAGLAGLRLYRSKKE